MCKLGFPDLENWDTPTLTALHNIKGYNSYDEETKSIISPVLLNVQSWDIGFDQVHTTMMTLNGMYLAYIRGCIIACKELDSPPPHIFYFVQYWVGCTTKRHIVHYSARQTTFDESEVVQS